MAIIDGLNRSASTGLADLLLERANATGGWGYYAGKASRIEPTSWALLALESGITSPALDVHRRFLLTCQRGDALLAEDPALPVNFSFNALAAVAMLRDRRGFGDEALVRLLAALVAHKGERSAQTPSNRQDNSLQGWSWVRGTFSWTEPTAWALLALKRARRSGILPAGGHERIDEAERLLIDRVCASGGWNYGNSNVLGKELFPYVSTTAVSLLALQDRRETPVVSRSLSYLESGWPKEPATISLALASICLSRYGRPVEAINARLSNQVGVSEALGNLHAIALAQFATSASSAPGHADAFAI